MKTPQSKKMMFFLAIYKADEGGYWSRFTEFPAADQGETLQDTVMQSTAFLQGIIDGLVKNGLPIPQPQDIEDVRKHLDPEDGEPVRIVPVQAYPPSPTVRIQLTGKANQIAEIDAYARQHGFNRSELMILASLEYIHSRA